MQRTSTDRAIAESFKKLVQTTPIDKITIKEITDSAGVIRPTFYNHFQDKYELLEWIIKEELIFPTIPLFQGGFIKEGITLIFVNMEKEKEFYTHASKLEGQNSFSSIVQKLIEELLLQYIVMKAGANSHFHNWMTPEMLAEYYASSIRFITMKWTTTGMPLPPSELAYVCTQVFESNIEEITGAMK